MNYEGTLVYTDNNRIYCICTLYLIGNVALVKEHSDNKGMSIHNAIENVAASICNTHKIDCFSLVLIVQDSDGYNLVTFIMKPMQQLDTNNPSLKKIIYRFSEPDWKLITLDEFIKFWDENKK